MEQLDMLSQQNAASARAEVALYNHEILPLLRSLQNERNISLDDLHFVECKGYCSLYFKTFLAFQIKIGKLKSYLAAPTSIVKELPADDTYYQIPSNPNFTRIPIHDGLLTAAQRAAVYAITLSTIDRCQKDFDCCSRYMECSDAKMCIHPDKKLAIGCGYRKILESGTVFYGKNRNID